MAYCFFQACDGFLQIQSSEEKAQTFGNPLFPHISGLLALQPYVCNSVSFGCSGVLKGIVLEGKDSLEEAADEQTDNVE